MNNADMPANPTLWSPSQHGQLQQTGTFGLTKREYFAGLAMQGMLSNQEITKPNEVVLTEFAIKAADALLKALEESNNE